MGYPENNCPRKCFYGDIDENERYPFGCPTKEEANKLYAVKETETRVDNLENLTSELEENKADKTEVNELATDKADKSELIALAETVENKADKTEVNELATGKADKEDLEAVAQTVETKADKSELEEIERVVDLKANKAEVDEKTADLQTQINNMVTGVPAEAEVLQARGRYNTLNDRLTTENAELNIRLEKYEKGYKPFVDEIIASGSKTYDKSIISGNTYIIRNKSESATAKISVSVDTESGSVVLVSGLATGEEKEVTATATGKLKVYADTDNAHIVIENTSDIAYRVNGIESDVESINATIDEMNKVRDIYFDELTVKGYISPSNGKIVDNTGFSSSDFIAIGQNCTVSGLAISNGNYAICAFYDKSQNYISNSAYAPNVEDYTKFSVDAPVNAAFVRISVNKKNTFSVFNLSEKIDKAVESLENRTDELSKKISVVDDSKTLVITDFTENGYINVTGLFVENTGFVASDYIEIKDGAKISGKGISNGNYSIYAFYNEAKRFITNSSYAPITTEYIEYNATIPDNARYVRFCSSKNNVETTAEIEWTIETAIEDINEKINALQVKKTKEFFVGYGLDDNEKYFESLVACMCKAQEFDGHKIINIQNGEYDILEELGGMAYILSKNVNSDTWQNIQPYLNDVEIIGHGNVKLLFNLDDDTPRDNYWLFSALNITGDAKVENIEIHAKNCRYCIHDESGAIYQNTKREYINVRCFKSGEGGQAVGSGFSENTNVYVNNCIFDTKDFMSTWTCHAKNGCQLVFNNSVFRNVAALGSTAVRISETGIGQKLKAEFANCFITTGIGIREESSNPNAQGDTRIDLINTHVSTINNGYTVVNEPVISYNTIEGTETVLVETT